MPFEQIEDLVPCRAASKNLLSLCLTIFRGSRSWGQYAADAGLSKVAMSRYVTGKYARTVTAANLIKLYNAKSDCYVPDSGTAPVLQDFIDIFMHDTFKYSLIVQELSQLQFNINTPIFVTLDFFFRVAGYDTSDAKSIIKLQQKKRSIARVIENNYEKNATQALLYKFIVCDEETVSYQKQTSPDWDCMLNIGSQVGLFRFYYFNSDNGIDDSPCDVPIRERYKQLFASMYNNSADRYCIVSNNRRFLELTGNDAPDKPNIYVIITNKAGNQIIEEKLLTYVCNNVECQVSI